MRLEHSNEGGFAVIRCAEDRLDALVAVQFKDRFRDLTNGNPSGVILDMSAVQFMDSSGLGALVAVYKMSGRDKVFALAGLSPAVDRVLKLTRMDSVFSIYATPAQAIRDKSGDASASRQAS